MLSITVDRKKTLADYGLAPKPKAPAGLVRNGAFKLPNGDIFIVKPSKTNKGHFYAKKLVIAPSQRLTKGGAVVDFDFEYAPGAIYQLTEADRMKPEEATALMIKYGRCIMCGRPLKVAQSVERGMGKVCWGKFNGGD